MQNQNFSSEWEFTNAVIELAESYGWQHFHIPARAYQNASIPQGFPDLLLRYKDTEGRRTMVVMELKTDDDEGSTLSDWQHEFLEDFAQHVPAFVFRYRDWEFIDKILRDGPPDTAGQIIEPSPQFTRSKQWLPPQRNINAIVFNLVEKIGSPSFPRRDLAALRRMDPDAPDAAVFWQLMAQENLLGQPTIEKKWALILHGIALMTNPTESGSAHAGRVPVGWALYLAGDDSRERPFYSESRLNRLLTARGPMLRTLLARMFRMMGDRQAFDWREMAGLILNEGYREECAEEARRNIARAYYEAERRLSQSGSQ